jgi:predicted RND superfamily exporter protein
MVIATVMALMHLNGQQLGVAESLSLVVLIGFSVDYIVHLSADYMHSAHVRRYDKMRQAYREMGVSILSGCITTFGCGFCLFFGNFTFFIKFGTVICSTIVTAFMVSMFTLGSFCHIFGPEKNFGGLFAARDREEEDREEQEEINNDSDLVQVVTNIQKDASQKMNNLYAKLSTLEGSNEEELSLVTEEFQQMKKDVQEEQNEIKRILT